MSNDRFSNYGAGKVAGAIEEQERILQIIADNLLPIGDIAKVEALIKGETND